MDRLQDLVSILYYQEPDEITGAIIAELISYGEDAVFRMLHIFTRELHNPYVFEIYHKMADISVPTLINVLGGNFKQETHFPIRELKKHAALALRALKDVRAVEPLLECIKKSKDAPRYMQLCYYCAETLAELGEPALQRILELLNDTNLEVEALYWFIRAAGFTKAKEL